MANARSLSLCALLALAAAGCKSEPPRYPGAAATTAAQTATMEQAATMAQTATVGQSTPAVLECPSGAVLLGFGPPEGTEVWCATDPGDEKHGPTIRWWNDSTRQSEGSYAKGKLDGVWTWWHANGQKSKEGTFTAGKKTGTWTFWNAEGFKVGEARFEGGRMIEQQTWERTAKGKIKTNRVNANELGKRSSEYESVLPVLEPGVAP